MRSMTGFGSGDAALGGGRVCVEVRSLNHRFLETRVRLPAEIADHTFYVEQRCRDLLNRGRYDISARLEGPALAAPSFDVERARLAYAALSQLRDDVAPGAEIPLSLLASLPDLLNQQAKLDVAEVRTALDTALDVAVEGLNEMRRVEGAALEADLLGLLQRARGLRDQIASNAPALAAAFRKRVEERLERVLRERPISVEPARLEAEVVLLAERADLCEELARLESHFDQFAALCAEAAPIGRRLDFLLQEVGREANTIGSKCQDAALAHLVVELKTEVERMREQVQNIE